MLTRSPLACKQLHRKLKRGVEPPKWNCEAGRRERNWCCSELRLIFLLSESIGEVMLAVAPVVPLGAACIGHPLALLSKVLYILGTRPSSELSRH